MPKTAGFVLQRLTEWDIHRIYGYPGDGINGFLGADRPCVPEVVVDPEIPPVPPHIKKELGKKAATAMIKGDPEEIGIITKGVKQKVVEFTESIKEKLPGSDD